MLSPDQLRFFARNGFVKVDGLATAETCRTLVDWTKEHFPADWDPDRPDSWCGGALDACHDAGLVTRRGRMLYRLVGRQGDPRLETIFGPQSPVARAASALVGTPLERKLRGLYPIFPLPPSAQIEPFIEGHVEAHPSHVISVTYAGDAPAGGGALLVWPGSHRAIYPTMASRLDHVRRRDHVATINEWTSRTPIELPGTAGDVILMHHRLVHAPSVNRSRAIRYASLCDFRRPDFKALCALPPAEDMWEDWPAVAALPAAERDAPSDWDLPRQAVPMPVFMSDAARLAPNPDPAQAVTKRKGDASVLERMRVPGEYWLGLSDVEIASRDPKLFPRGSALTEAGVSLSVDSVPRPSRSQYDYLVPLAEFERRVRVAVNGLDRTVWLRLIDTRLPLDQSVVLGAVELAPGNHRLRIDVDADVPISPLPPAAPRWPQRARRWIADRLAG